LAVSEWAGISCRRSPAVAHEKIRFLGMSVRAIGGAGRAGCREGTVSRCQGVIPGSSKGGSTMPGWPPVRARVSASAAVASALAASLMLQCRGRQPRCDDGQQRGSHGQGRAHASLPLSLLCHQGESRYRTWPARQLGQASRAQPIGELPVLGQGALRISLDGQELDSLFKCQRLMLCIVGVHHSGLLWLQFAVVADAERPGVDRPASGNQPNDCPQPTPWRA
jgi:hypothetical protein